MKTTYGTFPLGLSFDPTQEPIEFEVEVEAEITEPQSERGPTYSCGGEPAVEGHAEIVHIEVCDRLTYGKKPIVWHPASWLLNIIPQTTLDAWAVTLYEDYSPEVRDVLRDRFDMITGKAAAE